MHFRRFYGIFNYWFYIRKHHMSETTIDLNKFFSHEQLLAILYDYFDLITEKRYSGDENAAANDNETVFDFLVMDASLKTQSEDPEVISKYLNKKQDDFALERLIKMGLVEYDFDTNMYIVKNPLNEE